MNRNIVREPLNNDNHYTPSPEPKLPLVSEFF